MRLRVYQEALVSNNDPNVAQHGCKPRFIPVKPREVFFQLRSSSSCGRLPFLLLVLYDGKSRGL